MRSRPGRARRQCTPDRGARDAVDRQLPIRTHGGPDIRERRAGTRMTHALTGRRNRHAGECRCRDQHVCAARGIAEPHRRAAASGQGREPEARDGRDRRAESFTVPRPHRRGHVDPVDRDRIVVLEARAADLGRECGNPACAAHSNATRS